MTVAVIITALPPLGHGRSSLLPTFRIGTRATTRCSSGSWSRECHSRAAVHSSDFVLVRRRFGIIACVESEAEVGTLSKTVRNAGVGLLASLITLAANFHFPGPVFGSEIPLEVSQIGHLSEKSVWDASPNSGDISGNSIDSVLGTPLNDSFSRATSHDEISTVAETVTLLDECSEEIATNLVPKEEAVQEVTNESIVQEAWQVVNENFLDARHDSWSTDAWLKKKEEVLKSPIRSRMAAYGAIRTLLSSLNDPYTRFLTADQFSQLSKYDVTGIGLNIGESATPSGDSYLKVFGIIIGSPAQLVGVRQGDELLEVAGNSVRGKTPFEAASLIQGPKGTMVSIKIRHGRCGTPQVFEVERQQDVRSPVYYRLERVQDSKQLSGYIHLKEFNALAKRDILIAMKRMQDAGAVSFVLDLRDNPGGLVQAGIEVARLFLDEGETVIETVGRDAKNIRTVLASHSPITEAPLTILVNDHTASASEIVAAALHDNCRAVLVGNRTFGKGLIQAVYELSDGSGVVLTVGKYVTPGHQDIDGAGIEPDYKQLPSPSAGQEKLRGCKLLKASGNSSRDLVFS